MSESVAIRLENVSKTFGRGKKRVEAVKDVNLEIKSGQVYGLLGPNGAGKTTTIRLLLDLMRPTKGSIQIMDKEVRQHHSVLRNVGSLVEGAAFYPYLSGYKNLKVLAHTYGLKDMSRIDALLEQVDLTERKKQRFSKYSMGMKQRLGLAAALLHDPKLVILDEPTNGLDPAGIQEMRGFIRDLVDKYGKTVVLSSHMLNEVEQVCDRVAIIRKGEIIREGKVSDLLAEDVSRVKIRATPYKGAMQVVSENWKVSANGASPNETYPAFTADVKQEDIPRLVYNLIKNKVMVYEISPQKHTLEEVFLNLTGEKNNDSRS